MSLDDAILTISVASKLLKLHPRTIMLYEKYGLISPHRTNTQSRLFSIEDLNNLQFVKYLSQEIRLNIEGIKLVLRSIDLLKKNGVDYKKLLFPDFKPQKLF